MYKIIIHLVFNFSTKRPHDQPIKTHLAKKVKKMDDNGHLRTLSLNPGKINELGILTLEETQINGPACHQIGFMGNSEICKSVEANSTNQNFDNFSEHIGKEEYCEFLEYLLKYKDDSLEMENFQRQIDDYTKEKTLFNIEKSTLRPSSTTEILPQKHIDKDQNDDVLIENGEQGKIRSTLYSNYPFITDSSINNGLSIDKANINGSIILNEGNFLPNRVDVFIDTFRVSEFFICYLSNLAPIYVQNIIKHFERKITETIFSVYNVSDKKIEQLKKNNSFVTFSYNVIKTLERKFFIRLFFMYKFVTSDRRLALDPTTDFVMNDQCGKNFTVFFHNYICSSYVHNFFKHNFVTNFEVKNFKEHVNQTKETFNSFLGEYAKQVKEIFSNKFEKYSQIVRKSFLFNDLKVQKAYMQVWLANLINNKTNSLLIILFPEIKFILNKIKQTDNLRLHYKRTHFFFSLLVFKLNYNLPRFKYEFEKISKNKNFLITDSKFINLFVLEMRCLIYFYGVSLFVNAYIIKLFLFKAFVCYTRSHNPKLYEYFLFNEYTIFEDLNHLFDQISANFKPSTNFYLSEFGEFCKEANLHILEISDKLISEEIYKLSEENKLQLINQNKMNDDQEAITFESKNQDIIKKVTIVFDEYFKSFKK